MVIDTRIRIIGGADLSAFMSLHDILASFVKLYHSPWMDVLISASTSQCAVLEILQIKVSPADYLEGYQPEILFMLEH